MTSILDKYGSSVVIIRVEEGSRFIARSETGDGIFENGSEF